MIVKLVPRTIRLETAIDKALVAKAEQEGQEVADYAASVLAEHLLPLIEEMDPVSAKRLQAELELKNKAIALAQRKVAEGGFDPSVTLRVFQTIREDDELNGIYLRAIGDRPGDERGNPIKARINRSLGAAIKTAVGAKPQMVNGNPVKAQVSNEYIFSYTLLEKA